jgi:hypothetical protein
MSTALTLVVLIVAGDANDPTTTAMTFAAREALGGGALVVVREVPKDISDDDAVGLGHSLHADSVVEVTWKDAAHLHARMHLHSEKRARWIDREISFDAADADSERGRTLGFTVASMLPEHSGKSSDDATSAPSASTPSTPSSIAPKASSPPSLPSTAASRDAAPPTGDATLARRWSAAIDLAASGGLGIGGDASGIGGALAGQWYLGPRFSLRLGGAVRSGDVAQAQATSLEIAGGPGVAWRSHTPSLAYPLGFSLRADLLVVRHALSRSGDASRPARFIPAADLMLDVSWLLAERTAFFAAMGPEVAFGATDVVVRGERVATIPLLRGIAELGLRVRF